MCTDISHLIEEARNILVLKGEAELLDYCKAHFGENDGVGIAEDIIELAGFKNK